MFIMFPLDSKANELHDKFLAQWSFFLQMPEVIKDINFTLEELGPFLLCRRIFATTNSNPLCSAILNDILSSKVPAIALEPLMRQNKHNLPERTILK